MTEERLIEIEKRARAASEGEWLSYYVTQSEKDPKRSEFGVEVGIRIDDGCGYAVCVMPFELTKDAYFIANARQDVPDLVEEVRRLRKEVERYQIAEEDGRLVVLPARKELDERLCDFCDYPDEKKGTHLGPNGPYGCEGSWCKDAYDRFLDEVEYLTRVQVGRENENDT